MSRLTMKLFQKRRQQDPARIALVVNSIQLGGTEKVASVLANQFVDAFQKVCVLTFDENYDDKFYSLSQEIKYIPLGLNKRSENWFMGLINNFQRIRVIRKKILGFDASVVITMGVTINLVTFCSLIGTGVSIVGSERIDPYSEKLGMTWRILRRILYRYFKKIVVPTELMKQRMIYLNNTVVIPNPILPIAKPDTRHRVIRKKIVGIGRLVPQKRFDLLIIAFSKIERFCEGWQLYIFGEGPENIALSNLIDSLKLDEKVFLSGRLNEVQSTLFEADVFALTSDYEGFPNVLLEAMQMSVACLATNCPTGPSELITHRKNGLLCEVGSVAEIADGLLTLVNDESFRKNLGFAASQNLERFSGESVSREWQKILS